MSSGIWYLFGYKWSNKDYSNRHPITCVFRTLINIYDGIFAKIFNAWKLLTFLAKNFISDIRVILNMSLKSQYHGFDKKYGNKDWFGVIYPTLVKVCPTSNFSLVKGSIWWISKCQIGVDYGCLNDAFNQLQPGTAYLCFKAYLLSMLLWKH